MKLIGIAVLLGLSLAAVAGAAEPATNLTIEQFSPQGTVKDVRQVTARFSAPMVALGDPRLPDPFSIDCSVTGKGRWADGRNWVYDFDADLPGGVRCRFIASKHLHSLDGATLGAARSFSFTTGGPSVQGSLPREGWEAIDEDQIFLLRLDAPATPESMAAHVHCAIDGIAEQVPVDVLTGDERAAVLKERAALGYDYYRLIWKSGLTSQARLRNHRFESDADSLVTLRCRRHLPPATTVRLLWGKGVMTPSGIASLKEQTLAFRVRPAFTAEVDCTRSNARSGCLPMQPITVNFSAPVAAASALAIRLKGQDGTVYSPLAPTPGGAQHPRVPATLETVSFAGPFPDSATLTVVLPDPMADDAGRALENAARFPLELAVSEYPPLAKFSGNFGILEAREGGILPVTLRNLEPRVAARITTVPGKMRKFGSDPAVIADWLRRVENAAAPAGTWIDEPAATAQAAVGPSTAAGPPRVWREDTGTRSVFGEGDAPTAFTIDKTSGAKPAEVIGIPLKQPGFYVVELESRVLGASLLGRDQTRYVATAALVTNLAVHFKWGRESSRVWVTRLDSGEPVADADVVITDYCTGAMLFRGSTARDGLASVETSLGDPHGSSVCAAYSAAPLLVLAAKAGDFSFTQSGWAEGIDPYQFNVPVGNRDSTKLFHTVFDRSLFRAGETVSMTHFLRQHRMTGIGAVDGLPGERQVTLVHGGSGQRYELTAQFGADGIATSQWRIPPEAKLGDYTVSIEDGDRSRESGRFKVEQFRLPTMSATATLPARPLIRPKEVPLDIHIAYLAGGGASGLAVKLRTMVESQPLRIPGYDDYEFGGAPVQEGVSNEGSGSDTEEESERSADSADGKAKIVPLTLDRDGTARFVIGQLPPIDSPARLLAEIEYADADGELLTASARVRLLPSAVTLGIRREGWIATADHLRFRLLALDADGKPRAAQAVTATLYQSSAYSFRKRLIGGFYAYETTREVHRLAQNCAGTTDAQGILLCDVAPGDEVSGEVLVRGEAVDSAGHTSGVTASIWVAGKDDWWFGGTSGDRMDVLPEKKRYEIGETARFQVRMPFRTATALVTVEREGVLLSFVAPLEGHSPVIEVPITDAYAPNVFVSVLAVRGRVAQASAAGAPITALVDLNKPAYRVGLAQIKVGWKPHALIVSVEPDRAIYKIRDEARVRVHVRRADGTPLPSDSEVTVAAVDEALLELAPNPSWELLEAMMGERGLEVWTSTAQMQVVGKRHYGRKAVPHGGGGGRGADRAREQFDSLLLWKDRLRLDSHGEAAVRIPLNDSLSSFRIAAIAHGGTELYGTGTATIATSQDVILLSGLPPLVREGDRFTATFTVRNTTQEHRTVDVAAALTPAPPGGAAVKRLEIPAGQSRDAAWPMTVPVGTSHIDWRVEAQAAGTTAFDRLHVTQSVIPAFPVRTYQATLAQLTRAMTIPAERPRGALPGSGGLTISMQAKLGDTLGGVREYMSAYPYICLEQQLSRAVALRDRALWDATLRRLPAYLDQDGLLKYFPSDRLEGDDALSAYLLAIADEAGWALDDADKRPLVQALRRFVTGKLVRRSALPTADLTIRKLAALDALSRYGEVDAGMLGSLTIEPDRWPTSAVLDWLGILQRVPGLPDATARRNEALTILHARLNFQGTTLGFSTERTDALWWLMISADSNANRMLLAALPLPEWREDIPRLVRGALGRQHEGHWNTTLANAWGVLALEKFSAAFESTPVTGATAIQYAAEKRTILWPAPHDAAPIDFPWQEGRQNLGIAHSGGGKPWILVRASAALPLNHALSTGFTITRRLTAVEQHVAGRFSRGDVFSVHLDMEADADMSWVVVDDPVPAGATVLGSGLGGESELVQRGAARTGAAWPAFEERRFDAYRAYYRFVPKGHWSLDYTLRFNNPGTFLLPATRVEAMYAPEMFGESPNDAVTVEAGS